MRSRSNSADGSSGVRRSSRHRGRSRPRNEEHERAGRSKEGRGDTGTVRRSRAERRKGKDLSRDDLLFLLSMLEGELEVRGRGGTQNGRTLAPRNLGPEETVLILLFFSSYYKH